MDEHDLIYSGHSAIVERDGIWLKVNIYRMPDSDWSLEVVNDEGVSSVWNTQFPTDDAAMEEFERTVKEEGAQSLAGPVADADAEAVMAGLRVAMDGSLKDWEEDREYYEEFLKIDAPKGSMQWFEMQGLMYVLNCAPTIVPPSQWMALIFKGQAPEYDSDGRAQMIIELFLRSYNEASQNVQSGQPLLPPGCDFSPDPSDDLGNGDVAQWSQGFLTGFQFVQDKWEQIPDHLWDPFSQATATLGFFASREIAEELAEDPNEKLSVEELCKVFSTNFPSALQDFASITLHAADGGLPNAFDQDIKAPPKKVGRNEPCPCGSGKKYKKCCLH